LCGHGNNVDVSQINAYRADVTFMSAELCPLSAIPKPSSAGWRKEYRTFATGSRKLGWR
jgi:hypothetical protein